MRKILVLIFLPILFSIMLFSNFFINVWGLMIDEHYFIPQESNIFQFKVTVMNQGSGDWWLYGEDDKYYYALNLENKNPKYLKFNKGLERKNFNEKNYHTW
jgi:hypothetical protein